EIRKLLNRIADDRFAGVNFSHDNFSRGPGPYRIPQKCCAQLCLRGYETSAASSRVDHRRGRPPPGKRYSPIPRPFRLSFSLLYKERAPELVKGCASRRMDARHELAAILRDGRPRRAVIHRVRSESFRAHSVAERRLERLELFQAGARLVAAQVVIGIRDIFL